MTRYSSRSEPARSDTGRGGSDRYGSDRYRSDRYGSEPYRSDRYAAAEAPSRGERPPRRPAGGGGAGSGDGGGAAPGGPQFNMATIAVLAGVLVVGIGIGTAISSTTQGNQGNIASSQQLDMAVPDPEFCRQWGASAFVMDVEIYTTMNPSSSFVTQPALRPGCVIRRENWSVL
ncbi:MAG: DUF3172 domain-containing protein, partial [Cyanobium sp. Prado107]|nr:DUF3172 domain-containing protein [Cyanobium sp. Prado107]